MIAECAFKSHQPDIQSPHSIMSLQPTLANQREMRRADAGKLGPGRDRGLTVIRIEGHFAAHQPGPRMQAVGFKCQIDLLARRRSAQCRLEPLISERLLGKFAMQMRDQSPLVGACVALQTFGKLDCPRPVANHLCDIEPMLERRALVSGLLESVERLFGTIEQTCSQEVGAEFEERMLALRRLQVGSGQQALMDANRPVCLTAATKQIAQSEVQLDGFGVELDHVDEGIDRLVGLFVEQKVQALEIGIGQVRRFTNLRPGIDARSEPSKRKKQRDDAQPPKLELHRLCLW